MPKPCIDKHPTPYPGCRLCELYEHDARYRALWMGEGPPTPKRRAKPVPASKRIEAPCLHLGDPTGETVQCRSCRGRVMTKVFRCGVHGKCSIQKRTKAGYPNCLQCADYVPRPSDVKMEPLPPRDPEPIPLPLRTEEAPEGESKEKELPASIQTKIRRTKWTYGVTTVPERMDNLLPETLRSLDAAGFSQPHLFVDGDQDFEKWERAFPKHRITLRQPKILTYGNWGLAAMELFIREPQADRYAIFQDDLICVKGLRDYLSALDIADDQYWNLYTFPENEDRIPRLGQTVRKRVGFFMSNQRGFGAVALVFNRASLLRIITHDHWVTRPLDGKRGHRAIDGGIVTAMKKSGGREYIHYPSLVQHTGDHSSMRNNPHPKAPSFPGEDFDAMSLLKEEGI